MLNQVRLFAITGGPCSGKTSALLHIAEQGIPGVHLSVVPEAATLYHAHGARVPFNMPPSTCGRISAEARELVWELLLNELKRSLETRAINAAAAAATTSRTPSIVLADRGIFDSAAYLPSRHAWRAMLQLAGWEERELAARYEHVFHMAMCPEAAYSRVNNKARRESFDEAAQLDRATWEAWTATHADRRTLVGERSGRDGFDAKVELFVSALSKRLRSPPARPRRQQRRGWHLPPREVIALADVVASSEDLSRIAPMAVSVVRHAREIDALPHAERAFPAEVLRRDLRRDAALVDTGGELRDRLAPSLREAEEQLLVLP